VGFVFEKLDEDPDLDVRESFLLVSLTWLSVAIIGAIPYVLAGDGTIATPVNALFESMSGFTTTGATVMGTISFEAHSPSIMLWRQLSQWLGGMGIIVLSIAILPKMSVGGSELIKAEAPGPEVQKLTPRIVETAQRLWFLYVSLTVSLGVLLYASYQFGFAPKMDLYNAVSHALTTMPTGGFSPEARSIEAFSPTVQWIIVPFMFLAGANFALQWRVFSGRSMKLWRNTEFMSYLSIVLAGTVILTLMIHGNSFTGVSESIRHSSFQVLTMITTTGYASHDFETWNTMAQTLMFLMMFIGGCAGSTGGGIKVFRWLVTVKAFFKELFTTVHPRAVRSIRVGGNIIKNDTVQKVTMMILLYVFTFLMGTLLIEIDAYRVGLELETLEIMSASAACIGNIGPGFGLVGPMGNYLSFSWFSKLIMVVLMWAGRLELFTLFVIFLPHYWRV
jgi:trk system potassium uptake protein TrkH